LELWRHVFLFTTFDLLSEFLLHTQVFELFKEFKVFFELLFVREQSGTVHFSFILHQIFFEEIDLKQHKIMTAIKEKFAK